MKKILALIGVIIALAVIVHAEAKDRKDTHKDLTGQEISRMYDTLSLMREMVVLEERIVKGGNKKRLLADLAQTRHKLDRMIAEMGAAKLAPRENPGPANPATAPSAKPAAVQTPPISGPAATHS